jgi:hypothetical protein
MSGSIEIQPLTWNPPTQTWIPTARSGRAISMARGNWLVCTPTKPTSPWPPVSRICSMIRAGWMRVLVSSQTVIRSSTSSPSTRRCAQSSASPYSAASVFEGMDERAHWMT